MPHRVHIDSLRIYPLFAGHCPYQAPPFHCSPDSQGIKVVEKPIKDGMYCVFVTFVVDKATDVGAKWAGTCIPPKLRPC